MKRASLQNLPSAHGDSWPLIVVGAGAAGLTAAIFAARRGLRVLALETRGAPGAKIRVSGGGRCNILPSEAHLEDFTTSGSVKALRNVLFSWPLADVRGFFEEQLSLPLALEAATGKLFPRSNDARDVVRALLGECERAGVTVVGDSRVSSVQRAPAGEANRFAVTGPRGERLLSRSLILATGGLSLPKTGSDGGGLHMAADLGHHVAPTHPALVPLVGADPGLRELAGISLPATIRAVRDGRVIAEREREFLFTHRGYSGPVVLDMSHHVTAPGSDRTRLHVRWGGAQAPDWDRLLRSGNRKTAAPMVREHLPRRLADRLLERAGVPADQPLATLTKEARSRLVGVLEDFVLPVAGDEGYGVAEVTGGGIPLSELHLKTLESRRVPGLHFAGEILDVVGHIGGYNFLWAWVSGRRAGEGAAGALSG